MLKSRSVIIAKNCTNKQQNHTTNWLTSDRCCCFCCLRAASSSLRALFLSSKRRQRFTWWAAWEARCNGWASCFSCSGRGQTGQWLTKQTFRMNTVDIGKPLVLVFPCKIICLCGTFGCCWANLSSLTQLWLNQCCVYGEGLSDGAGNLFKNSHYFFSDAKITQYIFLRFKT